MCTAMQNWRTWLRWIAAAAVLMMLLLLGWQCIDLYQRGTSATNLDAQGVLLSPIFTMETVRARLKTLAVPLGVCTALIVVALAVYKRPETSAAHTLTPANRLRLLKKRMVQLPEAALREEKMRSVIYGAAGAVVLFCLWMCLTYLLDGSRFVSWDLEMVMGGMLRHVIPWTVISLGVMYIASVLRDRSMLRECDLLKGLEGSSLQEKVQTQHRGITVTRVALLLCAIAFIVLGVMNGGLYDVLVKAINICTECIGLG